MRKNMTKTPRRLLTATMGFVFMISLSACKNNTEGVVLDKNATYATAGDITVTNGDLWNELKWQAHTKLENQVYNVVLNDEINKLTLVLQNNYSGLSSEDKAIFENETEYNTLYETYSKRIVDYVVQDIYNFSFGIDSYWDELEANNEILSKTLEAKYIDELYTAYKVSEIDGKSIAELISNISEDNYENLLTIATNLSNVYYPQYAKELFAEAKKIEEVDEGDAEDTDEDDSYNGYYRNSNYVAKFKDTYANQFDLDLIMIRFSSSAEYSDTLRAFGIKIYNKNFYFISPEDDNMTYTEYCKFYNEISNPVDNRNAVSITDTCTEAALLEIYVQIYNYIYGGYRSLLPTSITTEVNSLNDLRSVTNEIVTTYNVNSTASSVEDLANAIIETNNEFTKYTRKELDKISTTYSKYLYETLDIEGDSPRYSTSSQNYSDSYYIAYKLAEGDAEYKDLYNKNLVEDEIFDNILETEGLEAKIRSLLIKDDLTSTAINNYINEELENIVVKIYDEAVEISYSAEASEYSKTHGKAPNENVLATITYNDVTWNVNIVADENDENSVMIPGKGAYGVYNDLELANGQTTALDIISTRLVKMSEAYKEMDEYRDTFEDYIEALLFNFANEALSSNGYPSSLGKYNFLMLYFHETNIDAIIDNYYRVQYASAKLLADYSNDTLIEFFKEYTDDAYNKYFSLGGERFVVVFDMDDDNVADDVETWKDKEVSFDLDGDGVEETVKLSQVAKELILKVLNEVEASTENHTDEFTSIVDEFNDSARVIFDNNPIKPENQWAKYRKVGLRVMTEAFSVTNSTVDVDFNLKQRLYDYTDESKYNLFMNDTVPFEYIEPITSTDQILETADGYNIVLVNTATSPASAKWTQADNEDDLLTDIKIKYNDEYITIENVYNDSDLLTNNQIKLYVLEYVAYSSQNLTPVDVTSAISTFLSPVFNRFIANETQRVIVKYFIENNELGGKLTYAAEGGNAQFEKLLEINQRQADQYLYLYEDPTGTSESFPDWWTKLEAKVKEFLM